MNHSACPSLLTGRSPFTSCRAAVLVAFLIGLPATGWSSLTVNLDFNGPGGTTESTRGGVLEPLHTFWESVAPTLGTSFARDTTFLFNQMQVNVIQAPSSTNTGGPFHDGITGTPTTPVRVNLENLVPGLGYTVVVYIGDAGNRVTVQGISKFNTGANRLLPGFPGHDYLRFNGVKANAAGVISVTVGVIDATFTPKLCGLQISGPFSVFHPDAKIGDRPSNLIGANRFSRTGSNQTVTAVSRRGRRVRFFAEAKSIGFPIAVTVSGLRSGRGCRISYFDTSDAIAANVTARVVAGSHFRTAVSASSPLKMRIEARPTRKSGRTRRKMIWLRVATSTLSFHFDQVRGRLVIR